MFVLRLLPVVELGLTFCEAELSVTQHSHCEYWLNAFAHILGVEFVFAEIASTSQTIRTSFFYDACVGLVQWSISNRDVSYTMELNSTSQKWRAFPETSAERCTFLPVFQSNVPFLSVRSRIL